MRPEDDVQLFEQLLAELVVKYEQYFVGVEKREPLKLREQVEALARKYPPAQIVNTMIRFRYNGLVAKLVSYQQHWNRTLRLIEEGKYSRDRFKMAMHEKTRLNPPATAHHHHEVEEEPATERSVDPQIERLYRQFLAARQACRLPTGSVNPEQIEKLIDKQRPELLRKFKCQDVDFQVVVVEGKPKIKAIPRR